MKSLCLLLLSLLFVHVHGSTSADRLKIIQDAKKGTNDPIFLDAQEFETIVEKEGQRDFAVAVLFTALASEYNCKPCHLVQSEYELVAKSWHATNDKRLFFAVLDFNKAQSVFQKKQITSAPLLYFYSPKQKSDEVKPLTYDFNQHGFSSEAIAAWAEQAAGVKVTISKPIDYTKWGTIAFGGLVFLAFLPTLLSMVAFIYSNKRFWMTLSLGLIVLMVSGEMWNRIRMPPYTESQNGKMAIFSGDSQGQTILETQIVAFLYSFVAISVVLLTTKPKLIQNPDYQRLVTYGMVLIFLFGYSSLLYVFRQKQRGYPFRLFF